MLNDPEVLFLDEPTIASTPVGARELRVLVRGAWLILARRSFTTHYMFEADSICDRIAVINKGKLVAEGTPASIKRLVEEQGVVEVEVEGISPDHVAGCAACQGSRPFQSASASWPRSSPSTARTRRTS